MCRGEWRRHGVYSQTRRKCLGRLAGFPTDAALERFERGGFVEMQDEVELIRESRDEVVAAAFGPREVDHANCALQSSSRQRAGEHEIVAQREQHPLDARL